MRMLISSNLYILFYKKRDFSCSIRAADSTEDSFYGKWIKGDSAKNDSDDHLYVMFCRLTDK